MKIITLIDGLNAGGAQRQLVGLSSLLYDEGFDVKLIWYHQTDFYRPVLENKGVPYLQLHPKGKLDKIFTLFYHIRKENPDVIIAYIDGPTMFSCVLKLFGADIKIIVSERNTTQIINRHVRLKFWLYRFADYVVPNSYSQTSFIQNNFPELNNKLVTITNYVDTDYFHPLFDRNRNIDNLRIVCVGRIFEQKNILMFLDSLGIVRDKGYNIEVHWYGNADRAGDYEKRCRVKVEEMHLDNIFYFEGSTPRILDCYQQADVFCLPSIYEGFPNVICEAMSCGLPILAGDICDNGRIVKDNINGFLFDPHDKESIAESILKFLNLSGIEKEKMGLASRALAKESFSKHVFLNKYIDLIDS